MEAIQDQGQGPLRITVQLLNPINHDGRLYSRGLHDLDAELAKQFLTFRDPISRVPIAQLPKKDGSEPKGTVSLDNTNAAYRQRAE